MEKFKIFISDDFNNYSLIKNDTKGYAGLAIDFQGFHLIPFYTEENNVKKVKLLYSPDLQTWDTVLIDDTDIVECIPAIAIDYNGLLVYYYIKKQSNQNWLVKRYATQGYQQWSNVIWITSL
jgi:hypothetical protein